MSTIAVETYVSGTRALAAASVYAAVGLPGPGEAMKTFRVGVFARDVSIALGARDEKASLIRIPVSWLVPDSNAFPHFQGFFEIRQHPDALVSIALLGYYHAPFGAAGMAFDAVAGHRIANATVQRLLNDVTNAMKGVRRSQRPA
jgi:hypothetical protein